MISVLCISVMYFIFGVCTVNRNHKIGRNTAVQLSMFLVTNHKRKYSHPLTANKNFCQSLAAHRNLDLAANRKPYT